ncbi:proline-specific permease [Trichophyton tonsurans CBS 112818]|uniref:Proline-specific permease n=1 Tax=Trichophyton tonsurans (strain CBS 112818) TaxID=647933 RepID=F2RSS4_TRIT1|nr:proline-specific permease [Trichophyton tonsurans CBS 112818]
MDPAEKPPNSLPSYHEYHTEPTMMSTDYPPTERTMVEAMVEEPTFDTEQRARKGSSVWSLAGAGPGGAVLCYLLMATVISSVISCLGEMTALMPVNAPVMEFPRRFVDRGVGFAVGWVYWFAYAVLAADQLVAVTNSVRFRYDDGKTFLHWETGENYYGELEYLFGSIKLSFITMIIVMMVVLDTMQPRSNAYYKDPVGTKYWDQPFSFICRDYKVRGEDNTVQMEIKGTMGSFLGMWTTIINVIFSYVGMDIVAATAAESKSLADSESMKMAARKINLRVITLYTLAMLTASFLVPRNHPFLNGKAQSVGSSSVFVIAVVEAGLPAVAHFFNAMYVFSAFTCAINSMYVASRVLHTLALREQTGPRWLTRRLQECHLGVPLRTVFATAGLMMIAYMGPTGGPGQRLGELATNCTVSCLIVYTAICGTYLCFYRTLDEAKTLGNTSQAQSGCYERDHPRYPYKSHGQWLKGAYGLFSCLILIIFNGVGAFLETPFNVRHFLAAYIGVPVFFLLVIGYKFKKHGFHFSRWGPERSNDLQNTVQVTSKTRKGRLEFPDDSFTAENGKTFVKWIWTWMK